MKQLVASLCLFLICSDFSQSGLAQDVGGSWYGGYAGGRYTGGGYFGEIRPSFWTTCGFHSCRNVPRGGHAQFVRVHLVDGTLAVCDTWRDGGGWQVIQLRQDDSLDFYQNWESYKTGFYSCTLENFWIGLELLHQMTSKHRYELRVDIKYQGRNYYAHYDNFAVGSEAEGYRLTISGYSGNAGDSMRTHNGMPFTTYDRDNDQYHADNCAVGNHGAWWYNRCHQANLNGKWGSTEKHKGVNWKTTTGFENSCELTSMKIRLVN